MAGFSNPYLKKLIFSVFLYFLVEKFIVAGSLGQKDGDAVKNSLISPDPRNYSHIFTKFDRNLLSSTSSGPYHIFSRPQNDPP